MATTTNFGWETPDDTDLVKDGAAAIRTALNGVDTSFADLKGGTTGQVLSKASGTDLDFTWVAQDDSNAIQNAIVDAKGDLIAATAADTPARLAVGSNGQVLTADSTASTGIKWATINSGGMTSLATGTLSGSSLDLTSISQSYTNLILEITDANWNTSNDFCKLVLNNVTTGVYGMVSQGTNDNGSNQSFYGQFGGTSCLLFSGASWLRTGKNSVYITIPNYTQVKGRRNMFGTFAIENSTPSNSMIFWQGISTDTAAVSRITFSVVNNYTFTGGTYTLWGVK